MLQGFGGTLTMLDGASGGARGAGAMQEAGQSDYGAPDSGTYGSGAGSGPGSSSGSGGFSEPKRSKGGAAKGGFDKQLDDEIPF